MKILRRKGNRPKAKRLRNQAKIHTNKVISRDEGICQYCKKKVVFARKLRGFIINSTEYTITYKVLKPNGVVLCYTHKRASLDHDKEISKGGDSSLENLKLSCVKCNQEKSNRKKKK